MFNRLAKTLMATAVIAFAAGSCATAQETPSVAAVAKTYADIAEAGYSDALTGARDLKVAIDALIAAPSEDTLNAARAAWIKARGSYTQTEAFRFGNRIVDDWEPRVNAWPLDEGLIDYVSQEYADQGLPNDLYIANVIANSKIKIGGEEIDASKITKELLSDKLQEAGGVESNVATGYHAIEFLLWGQDLNGNDAGAGNRPATDYDTKNCSNGNCDRRAQYLSVATDLLIDDLTWMVAQWGANGDARKTVMFDNGAVGLSAIFRGLGSLSYGELAGERMKLGLLIHDPEEEQDCFSDNTHNAHYNNALGIRNVYLGSYTRPDGTVVSGPSASDLVRAKSVEADDATRAAIDETMQRMQAIVARAEGGEAYDQMIAEGNAEGNDLVESAIRALIAQAKTLERDVGVLQLKAIQFEGSDSLDNPGGAR